MAEACTVIVGAEQYLDSLKRRADSTADVLAFSDGDAPAALAAITARRPQVVMLERTFASTARGAAFLNSIKTDAHLSAVDIRVVSHDDGSTRRSPRFVLHEGTEVQLEGSLAKIVDLSPIGAQVLSQQPLKPQQRVRIVLADDLGMVRLNAAVAWASYEIPKGVSRYRAGIEFQDAEPKAVEAFCMRHKK